MKTSGQCPKCACTKLYVVNEVRQPAVESLNNVVPFNVTTFEVPSADLGLSDDNPYRAAVWTFEAGVCSGCGWTEWYAKNVGEAFERAMKLGRRVHVHIAERPAGEPYR